MATVPKPGRRLNHELRAVDGSHLITLLSFRSIEQVMKAAPTTDDRMLSIWAVPESGGNASLVAVKNKGDDDWILVETPREAS